MSNRRNHAGNVVVADEFVELGSKSSTTRLNSIKQAISSAQNQNSISALRDQLASYASDGTITPSEKSELYRAWASLRTSYYKIQTQFEADSKLSGLEYYKTLVSTYSDLSTIMNKVLSDMDSTYSEDDATKISGLFYTCWTYINGCSGIYDSQLKFESKYTCRVIGEAEFNESTNLEMRIYNSASGAIVTDFNELADEFTWYTADGTKLGTGRTITVKYADVFTATVLEKQVYCSWVHEVTTTDADGNESSYIATFNAFITLSVKEITQYSWQTAILQSDLNTDSSAWFDTDYDQIELGTYHWTRVSTDNGTSWTYYRSTGEKGDDGADGSDGLSTEIEYAWWYSTTIEPYSRAFLVLDFDNIALDNQALYEFMSETEWYSADDLPASSGDNIYLWVRTRVGSTGDWTVYCQSQKSIVFTAEVLPASYKLNDRGVLASDEDITLTLKLTWDGIEPEDMPAVVSVVPLPSDSDHFSGFTGTTTESELTYTLSKGFKYDSIVFTVSTSLFADKTITVSNSNAGAEIENKNFGVLTTLPDPTDEWAAVDGPLEYGDYCFLVTEETDSEGNVTETIVPWIYTGEDTSVNNGWVVIDSSIDGYMETLMDLLPTAIGSSYAVSTTSSMYAFIGYLVADKASISQLFAKEIELQSGGSMHSKGYSKGDIDLEEDKQGFYYDFEGYSEWQNLRARNAEVQGTLDSQALVTVDATDSFTDIKTPIESEMQSLNKYSTGCNAVTYRYGTASKFGDSIVFVKYGDTTTLCCLSSTSLETKTLSNTIINYGTRNYKGTWVLWVLVRGSTYDDNRLYIGTSLSGLKEFSYSGSTNAAYILAVNIISYASTTDWTAYGYGTINSLLSTSRRIYYLKPSDTDGVIEEQNWDDDPQFTSLAYPGETGVFVYNSTSYFVIMSRTLIREIVVYHGVTADTDTSYKITDVSNPTGFYVDTTNGYLYVINGSTSLYKYNLADGTLVDTLTPDSSINLYHFIDKGDDGIALHGWSNSLNSILETDGMSTFTTHTEVTTQGYFEAVGYLADGYYWGVCVSSKGAFRMCLSPSPILTYLNSLVWDGTTTKVLERTSDVTGALLYYGETYELSTLRTASSSLELNAGTLNGVSISMDLELQLKYPMRITNLRVIGNQPVNLVKGITPDTSDKYDIGNEQYPVRYVTCRSMTAKTAVLTEIPEYSDGLATGALYQEDGTVKVKTT